MFLFCLVFAMFCARLFICASWSPVGKGLTSWLSFVVSSVSLSLSHWYPGSFMFLFCLVFAMFCARLFICASWSPVGKGLTSWLSFVVSSVSLVVLDCIDS